MDGPATGRSQIRDDRKKMILAAAVRVVAANGYHRTRIADIAEEAGVAYGLVYHYFGSKDRILSAIFEQLWEKFGRRIEVLSRSSRNPVDRLAAISDYMVDTYLARPDLIDLLVREVTRARHISDLPELPVVRDILSKIRAIFRDAVKDGSLPNDADPALLSFLFFGSVEMVLTALSFGLYSADGRRRASQLKMRMRDFIAGGSFGIGPITESVATTTTREEEK